MKLECIVASDELNTKYRIEALAMDRSFNTEAEPYLKRLEVAVD